MVENVNSTHSNLDKSCTIASCALSPLAYKQICHEPKFVQKINDYYEGHKKTKIAVAGVGGAAIGAGIGAIISKKANSPLCFILKNIAEIGKENAEILAKYGNVSKEYIEKELEFYLSKLAKSSAKKTIIKCAAFGGILNMILAAVIHHTKNKNK